MLRSIKGYEDFNDACECLEMLKGGLGLIDAPNLFTMRADAVMRENGIMPTTADPKIYLKFDNGVLALMVSTPMDDYKATGKHPQLKWLHEMLTKYFGEVSLAVDG